MKYTLVLGLGAIDIYREMAVTADEYGWDCLCVPDSIFFPKRNESDYPYADTEAVRAALEAVPVLEPLIAIAMMVAVTRNIEFYPGVLKVPVRQPVLLAKSISSLAHASGGRIKLGAGISPWKEDFVHNGVDFEMRGKRMDECVEILRGLMYGEYFQYHGEFYQFDEIKINPTPEKPVPIIFGGHSQAALRRAARSGDGWVSAPTDFETVGSLVSTIRQYRQEYGNEAKPFEYHCMATDANDADGFRKLEDIGVTHVGVTPWNPYDPSISDATKIDSIKRFAETFN